MVKNEGAEDSLSWLLHVQVGMVSRPIKLLFQTSDQFGKKGGMQPKDAACRPTILNEAPP